MSDALSVETRSRSRSKTPGILFGENGDSKGSKKIPTISLIEEEDDVIEVIPLSQAVRPKRQRRSAKAVTTLDTSSDVSIETSKNSQKEAVVKTSVTTTSTTTVKETVKKTSNGSDETISEQASTTATITKSSNDEVAESQSIFNGILNAIKTSTPILSNKRSQRIIQDATSSTINVAEHPAYKEYREAGEYWNKYPKTDYTYSELSPHRRELSNGIVAMPNMSRRSLENYQPRVQVMIQKNPTDESFLRRKFLSNLSTSFQKRSAELQYDSADEVDVSELRRQSQVRRKPAENAVSLFFTMIVSYIYTGYFNLKQSVRRIFYRTNERYTYTPIRKQRQQGIIRSGFESIKNFILLGFSKVYLLASTVLCLDTWMLYTRSENLVENRKRKSFLLLLILLLPLLLLGALLLSDDSTTTSRIYSNSAFSAPSFESIAKYWRNVSSPRWSFDFNLSWLTAPLISLGAGLKALLPLSRSNNEFNMNLDEENLQVLMAHVNRYIDTTISQRFKESNQVIIEQTNNKFMLTVAETVKEHLVSYNYQLTAADIENIAEKVNQRIELLINDKEKILLSKVQLLNDANLKNVQEQIKQNVNIHLNEIKLDNQNVDLNTVLIAVLNSEKLLALLDARLKPAFEQLNKHEAEINGIQLDIENLKADVLAKFTTFRGDIDALKVKEKSFDADFLKIRFENDERLKKMLIDIDTKLASFGESHFASIDLSVRENILHVLGFDSKSSNSDDVNSDFLKNWISSIFVAKSDLEERLKAIEANGNKAFQLQLDQNAGILMKEINEEINKEVKIAFTENAANLQGASMKFSGELSEADVLRIVKGVLAVYDADKTGLVDFALETAGGQVLSTRCTENFQTKSAEISIFGIPLWYPLNTPRTVISPSVHPGECWAFQGFPGYLVVQLTAMVKITGFTIEHISQSLAPNRLIDSAPNIFSVWGLVTEMDKEPVQFGNYRYSADENAQSLQYFPVQNSEISQPYQIVELRVESNHGNPRYTCLYRFRVHGIIEKP